MITMRRTTSSPINVHLQRLSLNNSGNKKTGSASRTPSGFSKLPLSEIKASDLQNIENDENILNQQNFLPLQSASKRSTKKTPRKAKRSSVEVVKQLDFASAANKKSSSNSSIVDKAEEEARKEISLLFENQDAIVKELNSKFKLQSSTIEKEPTTNVTTTLSTFTIHANLIPKVESANLISSPVTTPHHRTSYLLVILLLFFTIGRRLAPILRNSASISDILSILLSRFGKGIV